MSNVFVPESGFAYGLDWLRYSVASDVSLTSAYLPHPALKPSGEILEPLRGYNRAVGLTFGRLDYHTFREDMKIGVQFSGADLLGLTEMGIHHHSLISYAFTLPLCKFTRLDFAVDVFGQGSPEDVFSALQAGRFETKAKSYSIIQQFENGPQETDHYSAGCTLYIGSRQSPKMLRVYDKAAEQGLSGVKWLRVELEAKDDYAHQLALAMLHYGVVAAGKQAIKDFCQTDIDWLNAALESDSCAYIYPVGKKKRAGKSGS